MYETMKEELTFHSIERDQSLQKKSKKSFSPMKSLKAFRINVNQKEQVQPLPVMISSYTPQQNQQTKSLTNQQSKISYLFQYQTSKGGVSQNKRSEEEISLIMKLIEGNKIWTDLGFIDDLNPSTNNSNKNYDQMMKDICNSIVLVWSQVPNITETKPNEIYLILQGKSFEYIRNENSMIKMKIHENNDYIMIKKLMQNDYFFSLPQGKYKSNLWHNSTEKYQLMVDEKTLMGKISDDLFSKYIQKRFNESMRQITLFMRKIILFENLPDNVFQQLSKFVCLKRVSSNVQIIKKQQKSKEIYFIKKGEVKFKIHSNTQSQQQKQDHQAEILKQFDVFGMDTLHTMKTVNMNLEFSAESITDCEFYCIDKRILAIVISSFEKEFKKRQKIVKSVDINAQIKGQNYISKKQFLLNENAQRIKTAQKKIRDLKLRSYSRNKQRQVNTFIPEKDRIKERKIQTKSNQAKLKTSAGFKLLKRKSTKSQGSLISIIKESTDHNFWKLKKSLLGKYEDYQKQYQGVAYNQMILPVTEENDAARKTFTAVSNSSYCEFQKLHKKSLKASSSDLLTPNYKSKSQSVSTTVQSFIPKVQSRASLYQGISNSGKLESQLIKNYIEKKVKEEVVKKAQDILDRKSNNQRSSIKNIKKFYNTNSFSPSKKVLQIVRTQNMTRKQLTDQLFDRMANMQQHPLLSLIETQRKKLDTKPKDKNQTKFKQYETQQLTKAHFNQQKTLLLNSQGSTLRQVSDRLGTYPISSFDSKNVLTQN